MAIFDDINYEPPALSTGALDAAMAAPEPEKPKKGGFGALFNRPGASEALIAFGANMLAAPSFGEGLGRAGMAFVDTLRAEEERRQPKQQFLQDGALMASTDPMTGQTTISDVDPVQQFIAKRDQAALDAYNAKQDSKTDDQMALLDARYEHIAAQNEAKADQRRREDAEAFDRRLELLNATQDRQDARAFGLAAYRAKLDAGKDSAKGGKLLDSRNAKEIIGRADMADHLDRLVTTFKDEYAGKPGLDSIQNALGKYLGKDVSIAGVEISDPDQAQFWQDYDDFKGMIRNDRFGATLTNNEKRDFEKITVTPGMNPDTIRRNLDRQRQIVFGALARRMRMATSGGYNADQIIEAGGAAGLKALELVPNAREGRAERDGGSSDGSSRSVTVPKAHVDYLIKHPEAAKDFDAKYGRGAAAAFVRKRQGK